MNLERQLIDWKATGTDLRQALAAKNEKVPWLARNLAERLGVSNSSRSEIYALLAGKPFSLSDKKLTAIFEILGVEPSLNPGENSNRSAALEDGAVNLVCCPNPSCPRSKLELQYPDLWVVEPYFFTTESRSSKGRLFCKGCREELIRKCDDCGLSVSLGAYCECGHPYAEPSKDFVRTIEASVSSEEKERLIEEGIKKRMN